MVTELCYSMTIRMRGINSIIGVEIDATPIINPD